MSAPLTCPICGGDYKIIKREEIIFTRNPEHPSKTIEDLEFNQCIICGKTTLTDESKFYIQLFKKKMVNDEKKERKNFFDFSNFLEKFMQDLLGKIKE